MIINSRLGFFIYGVLSYHILTPCLTPFAQKVKNQLSIEYKNLKLNLDSTLVKKDKRL
jgi:hypothetical protein